MKRKHLSISEKRDWLASLFRDETGEISQAEKFKAMVEDTRLAMLTQEKHSSKSAAKSSEENFSLFTHLPLPLNLPSSAAHTELRKGEDDTVP